MRRTLCYAFAVLLASVLSVTAFAQTGQFTGRVTDSQDKAVVGADVRIFNQATGVERNVKTNAEGIYIAPFIQPGTYQIYVQAPGFGTVTSNPLTINIGQSLVFDVQLTVGSAAQQVTVDAAAQTINTTDASVSTVIDRQFVENLPLNGRSFQSLLYITPGVNLNMSASNNGYSQGQFVVNGQRGDSNNWMIDGVSANVGVGSASAGNAMSGGVGSTNALGGTSALVSVDALQEFRIETSTYAPEFGREPGGQISIQTRSGTNQFHGTAFDYLRNTDLDAKDWFADHDNLPKAAEIQNDFGGVIGGPILKDKTFFFFSAEALRLILPETLIGTVPDSNSRTQAIPSIRPYLNAYPKPQPGAVEAGPGYVTYSATYSNPGSADAYSLRIDHQLLRNVNVFARYNQAPSRDRQRGAYGSAANTDDQTSENLKTATFGATWTNSRQMVDDFRFNYSFGANKFFLISDSFGGGTPVPGENLFPSPFSYTNSNFLLFTEFGANMGELAGFLAGPFQHQYNVVDTFSLQKGTHSLKFGVDYRRLSPVINGDRYQLVPFFGSMDDFELGQSAFTYVYNDAVGTFLLHNVGVFGQDTWRIGSRLNLTYGLRWDIDFRPTSHSGINLDDDALTGFSLTNLTNLNLAPPGTPIYQTRYGNVGPRIGGAYRISTDPDWGIVLRGGFGVFSGLSSTEVINNNWDAGTFPFAATKFVGGAAFPSSPMVAALPPIEPPNSTNGETLTGFDPHLNQPYALEWDVALEQSLGKAQTFTLSYIGALDGRMLESETVNNPNPRFAQASLIGNTGTLNYNALQGQFQRRLTNGVQALVSYSWSHSIDSGSYGAYSNGGLASTNANRGDSDYDLRNVFSAALTYNVPVLKNNAVTRAITSGWSTDDVVQVRSGPPLDVIDASFQYLTRQNATILIRPDVVPGQPEYLTGSKYPGRKALNAASFTNPPVDAKTGLPTRQGDLGRNARRALGLTQWDFAAHREFPIYERLKLQFRAELFNILNHPNFAPFNTSFYINNGNPYFGQSTEMLNQFLGGTSGSGSQNPLYTPGSPRSGELALKLVF